MTRVETHIPRPDPRRIGLRGVLWNGARALKHIALSPAYLALARRHRPPGLAMRRRALRLLAATALRGDLEVKAEALRAAVLPLDSVRYFEFEFAWKSFESAGEVRRYLDLSSPRLFPLSVIRADDAIRADLANPDGRDLPVTRSFVRALGIESRCTLHPWTADHINFGGAEHDLVTSLSVLEHIPAPGDRDAAVRLLQCVRPGGRLVVTLPVARRGFDEYLDVNEYGVLPASESGWTFGQRVYDSTSLRETFLSVLGEPTRFEVFGERVAGTFTSDRARKASGTHCPWREPYMIATEYKRFASVDDLPGWGVAGLEFVKRAPRA